MLDRAQIVALVDARRPQWSVGIPRPERGDDGWATKARPTAPFRLAEDTFLHPPGSAPSPADQLCPLCGLSHPGRTCPGSGAGPGPGQGSAGGRRRQCRLILRYRRRWQGVHRRPHRRSRGQPYQPPGTDSHGRSLGPGAGTDSSGCTQSSRLAHWAWSLTYDVDVTVVLSNPSDTAVIRYHGSPADYAPLREALKQLLAPRQATLKAGLHAGFDPPQELSGNGRAAGPGRAGHRPDQMHDHAGHRGRPMRPRRAVPVHHQPG